MEFCFEELEDHYIPEHELAKYVLSLAQIVNNSNVGVSFDIDDRLTPCQRCGIRAAQQLGIVLAGFEVENERIISIEGTTRLNGWLRKNDKPKAKPKKSGPEKGTQDRYTVKDLCERFQVNEDMVLTWIRSGQLEAIDVGREGNKRPTWRITDNAVEAFEKKRNNQLYEAPKTKKRQPTTIQNPHFR